MKKMCFVLLMIGGLFAGTAGAQQIHLIGASTAGSAGINLLQWVALDSASVTAQPSILQAYYMASSAFDSYNGNYYLQGISADTSGLFSFNTSTGAQSMAPYTNFTNISDFDMSTGRIYDLRLGPPSSINIGEFDIATGTDSLVGVATEPGLDGLVVDAITFDANNGILYYAGPDGSGVYSLFAFHVRANPFTWTKVPLTGSSGMYYLNGLAFDNPGNKLFALERDFTGGFYTGAGIVEIDRVTGMITPRVAVPGLAGFVAGSFCFDQNSESYLLVGVDSAFQYRMVVVNTVSNSCVNGFVPYGVSEVECDNTAFARAFYATGTQEAESSTAIRVWPNPASDWLNIAIDGRMTGAIDAELVGMDGLCKLRESWNSTAANRLDVSRLPAGVYLLRVVSEGISATRKVVLR